jgi:RNA polymerase sigma factor (TIGR02999 family)
MPTPPDNQVTPLLHAWAAGDSTALDRLVPLVYGDLHRLAERAMRAQPEGHTLQATALVHETYLRLVERPSGSAAVAWEGRAHFFGVAARAMRSVLVDHARARRAAKRGGPAARRLTLEVAEAVAPGQGPTVDVLALDEALDRLAAMDGRKARLVELRYFAGLGIDEAAAVLGVSPATVKRDWTAARAWLRRELGEAGDPA